MQALVRTLKSKDQHIQESGVKIELMERRMETVKKQADTITDLETELQKARKQEKAYEDAMEQLQTDLDAFEQENSKLKQAAASAEKQGKLPAGPHSVRSLTIALQRRLASRLWSLKACRSKAAWRLRIF